MLEFDLRDYEREAKHLGAFIDQVPFAMANAMTTAAFKTRTLLIDDTWPVHVTARNKTFMRAALRVIPAKKHNLEVSIIDVLHRGALELHARGGTKTPLRSRLAIPPKGVRRGAHGIPVGLRPRAIVDNTPKRALRITSKGIFVGSGGRLHLKYSFSASAHIKPDVPFYEDFERYMTQEMMTAFPVSLEKAMATRR
jgi:hypothetical protein